jgi:hypothetical protein
VEYPRVDARASAAAGADTVITDSEGAAHPTRIDARALQAIGVDTIITDRKGAIHSDSAANDLRVSIDDNADPADNADAAGNTDGSGARSDCG